MVGVACPLPSAGLAAFKEYAADRKGVRCRIGAIPNRPSDAKSLLLAVANSASFSTPGCPASDKFLKALSAEGRVLRWVSSTALP